MEIKRYADFILEKSIGSEEIRLKHYGDLDKRTYYKIINLDPTSVRKKDFSKPGKYSKWLLYQYKIGFLDNVLLNTKKYTDDLTNFLFLFSTNWFANKYKKSAYYIGGEVSHTLMNDINKYSLMNFMAKMTPLRDEYLSETEDAQYDIVYSDDAFDIFVPLNFTASRQSAENTQWCSQYYGGYSIWKKDAILFRIIPKDEKLAKIKFSYRFSGTWFMAGPVYPELTGENKPFEVVDSKPNWQHVKEKSYQTVFEAGKKIYDEIENTMIQLPPKATQCMMDYYNLNKK